LHTDWTDHTFKYAPLLPSQIEHLKRIHGHSHVKRIQWVFAGAEAAFDFRTRKHGFGHVRLICDCEVEIIDGDFANATGVQSVIKDAVKAAVSKINQMEFEWPFNAAEETDVLIVGQEEYTWPTFFKVADWNSFQIQADATLGSRFTSLTFIERDEYYKNYRDIDHTSGTTGITVPRFVFPSHGSGYGVSPSPDKAYSLKFRYFLNYVLLELLHTVWGTVSRSWQEHI